MLTVQVKNTDVVFRALARSDWVLLQKWLAAPHVAAWWNERFDLASIEATYGPRIDGQVPMFTYLIHHMGVPIGWVQWYRWRDFPEHAMQLGAAPRSAGIDLAIGDLALTGRGLGATAIREFGRNYIFAHRDLETIVADPAVTNLRSVGAFLKAGFTIVNTVQLPGEAFQRRVVRLDRGAEGRRQR
jgi:aminoglycoside 6'-N-acetyltransferase